jgi:hypothetical protein
LRARTRAQIVQRRLASRRLAEAKREELKRLKGLEVPIRKEIAKIQAARSFQNQVRVALNRVIKKGAPALGTPAKVLKEVEKIINKTPGLKSFLEKPRPLPEQFRVFGKAVEELPPVKVPGVVEAAAVRGATVFENILTGERISAKTAPSGLFREIQVAPTGEKIGDVFRIGTRRFVAPPAVPVEKLAPPVKLVKDIGKFISKIDKFGKEFEKSLAESKFRGALGRTLGLNITTAPARTTVSELGLSLGQLQNITRRLQEGEASVKFDNRAFFLDEEGGLSVQKELPFGIGKAVRLEPGVVFGEEPTVVTLPNFLAREFVESSAGKTLLKQIKKVDPELGEFLETPVPKQAVDILTILSLGVFFDPAFAVGAIKKGGKTKTVQVSKPAKKKATAKKARKINIESVINEFKFRQVGKKFREKTLSEKVADFKKILNEIKKTRDPILKKRQAQEFKNLMRRAHGEEGANQIFREFVKQEGVQIPSRIPRAVSRELEAALEFRGVPTIRGAAIITAAVSPARTREQNWIKRAQAKNQKRIDRARLPLGERFKLAQQATPAQRSKQLLAVSAAQLSKQVQKQKQVQRQRQLQRQKQIQRQRQISRQKLAELLQPKLVSRVAPRVRGVLRPRLRRPIRRVRIPPIPLLPKKPKVIKKELKKIPLEITEGGFNVLVKSGGKFSKQNIVTLRKSKAEDLGSWLVDTSTARTFKLKSSLKKPKKPKLIVPNQYYGITKRKFRGPRRKGVQQPITLFGKRIEKSKHLIDSLGEKKQLSLARQRAKLFKKFKSRGRNKPPKLKSSKPKFKKLI